MNTSSIRIIGGRHKSYRIVFKATPALRPTSDRAKETLFSWLQFELENKSCLDLFAGTGGLGLEALSRGAKHVTFVEKEKNLYKNIIKNKRKAFEKFLTYFIHDFSIINYFFETVNKENINCFISKKV